MRPARPAMDCSGCADLYWQEPDRRRSMAPHTDTEGRKRAWVIALAGIGSMLVTLDTLVLALAPITIPSPLSGPVALLRRRLTASNLIFPVRLLMPAPLS